MLYNPSKRCYKHILWFQSCTFGTANDLVFGVTEKQFCYYAVISNRSYQGSGNLRPQFHVQKKKSRSSLFQQILTQVESESKGSKSLKQTGSRFATAHCACIRCLGYLCDCLWREGCALWGGHYLDPWWMLRMSGVDERGALGIFALGYLTGKATVCVCVAILIPDPLCMTVTAGNQYDNLLIGSNAIKPSVSQHQRKEKS